jgi:histidine triad (HIT) family protein
MIHFATSGDLEILRETCVQKEMFCLCTLLRGQDKFSDIVFPFFQTVHTSLTIFLVDLSGLQVVPICFENERVFAFYHSNPLWEHHVVLLPKKHIESLLTLEEADNDLQLELMQTAKMIAGDFMARFGAARVYTNLGEYQSSKHLHWHIGSGRQLRPY